MVENAKLLADAKDQRNALSEQVVEAENENGRLSNRIIQLEAEAKSITANLDEFLCEDKKLRVDLKKMADNNVEANRDNALLKAGSAQIQSDLDRRTKEVAALKDLLTNELHETATRKEHNHGSQETKGQAGTVLDNVPAKPDEESEEAGQGESESGGSGGAGSDGVAEEEQRIGTGPCTGDESCMCARCIF